MPWLGTVTVRHDYTFLRVVLLLWVFMLGFSKASYSQSPKIPLQVNTWDVIPLNPVFGTVFANERKLGSGKS